MQEIGQHPTGRVSVVEEAATIVDRVVRAAVIDALWAAELCDCGRCRTHAAHTRQWARRLLAPAGSDTGTGEWPPLGQAAAGSGGAAPRGPSAARWR